jgi:hypothetical protein
VVANTINDNIGVFLGYGNGSFQSQILYSTGDSSSPYSVATADFNNDSKLDIVVANADSDNIWVFFGIANGSFSGQIIYSMVSRSRPVWVAVGDFNNDTIQDIVVANKLADNICIVFGYGNDSFGDELMLSTGQNSTPISVTLGDFNQDKSMDIAVANHNSKSFGLFFGFGNGTFSSQKIYSVDSNASLHSIMVCDINNDALLDIFVADYDQGDSSFAIFYGFGDGNFTLAMIYPTGLNTQPYTIAAGDFNNDGRLDLAVNYYNEDAIGVFIQLGSEPFGSSALFSTGNQSQPQSVTVGDFNNDDYLDIAVANSGTNNIGILLGYGNGDFAHPLTYSTGNNSLPSSITVGHFNNDTYLDIAVVNSASDTLGIFLGYGNGRFANAIIYSTGVSSVPVAIAVNDLNKDNHLDLVVTNSGSNTILVFLGKGNGSFLEPKIYSLGYNVVPESVAIGYINNDNMLDIVVANYGTNNLEILLQTC